MTRVLKERTRIKNPGSCIRGVNDPEPEPEYDYISAVVVPDDWTPPKSVEDALEFETDNG